MTKSELRAFYLDLRKKMSADAVAEKSRAIRVRLPEVAEFAGAQTVLCYVASKDNEVDTRDLIRDMLREKRRVLVPIGGPARSLIWSQLEDLEELAPASFGILEPREECRRITTPPNDAAVIVPGIAFSPAGYRIGYGGGYYDRFLARFEGTSMAVAYDLQLTPDIVPEPHDIPVHYIVTESRCIKR